MVLGSEKTSFELRTEQQNAADLQEQISGGLKTKQQVSARQKNKFTKVGEKGRDAIYGGTNKSIEAQEQNEKMVLGSEKISFELRNRAAKRS